MSQKYTQGPFTLMENELTNNKQLVDTRGIPVVEILAVYDTSMKEELRLEETEANERLYVLATQMHTAIVNQRELLHDLLTGKKTIFDLNVREEISNLDRILNHI